MPTIIDTTSRLSGENKTLQRPQSASAAQNVDTDDPGVLDDIVAYLNKDRDLDYMRLHGGHVSVLAYNGDVLTLALQGNCFSCMWPGGIEGTKRTLEERLRHQFAELLPVAWASAPAPRPVAAPRP